MFLSIHQINDAARVCDRFVLLSGGRVRGEGTLDELSRRGRADAPRACSGARAWRLGRGLPCPHVTAALKGWRYRRYAPLAWLLRKEWRELVASRSWWVMLLAMGPLVGVSFISAVRTYAEASGLNGTAVGQGVGEAFSPLVGVWAPTFSACELAAAFLLPFVGIRLVSGDRQSGALKIELQHPDVVAGAHVGQSDRAARRLVDRLGRTRARRGLVEKLRRQRLSARAGDGRASATC